MLKKSIYLLLRIGLFSIVSILNANSENVTLNGAWYFKTDSYNVGKEQKWFNVFTDKTAWDHMQVPGSWNTRLEYSHYTGAAWYSTSFKKPNQSEGKDVILNFEAVYSDVDVWLNGEYLGSHDFGFTQFAFDVTSKLKDENELTLRVDNSFKLGATWNWGGVRRPVTIKILSKERIEDIYITSNPDLKTHKAEIITSFELKGGKAQKILSEIYDANGVRVSSKSITVDGHKNRVIISHSLKNVNLWNFDSPYLYIQKILMGREVYEEKFGIRKIEINGCKLLINGIETRLNGANYVPCDRFTGNTLPEDVFKRDIDLMKECGVNMARLSHLALPKDVLDYIDSKGILIFEEIPLWNKNNDVIKDSPRAKKWLTELITQRYNHPCIIGWSAGNEIGRHSDNPQLREYLQSAFKYIKSIDSTRLAVYVTNTAAKQDDEAVLLSDMILFNQYGSHGERVDIVNKNYPNKPIFYSEYGTKTNNEDINNNDIDIAKMLNNMRGREHLIGGSLWTFNDYRSNYKDANTQPTQNRAWGVVDAYGRKKRHFEVLQREYSPLKVFNAVVDEQGVKVDMKARTRLDLPSYDIVNHKLRVTTQDVNGKVLEVKERPINTLKVDSELSSVSVLVDAKSANKVIVELVSPVNYVIHKMVKFNKKPNKPSIKYAESGDHSIRVYFDKKADANEYFIIAEKDDGKVIKSYLTIDDNVLLEKLDYGKKYNLQLIAVNDKGESVPSDVVEVKTISAELPPVIVHLQIRDGNIEVGYTSSNADFIYEFEYGLSEDKLERHVVTTEFGAINLPIIKEGVSHYIRIRKRSRYGYESQWSKILKATNK